MESTVFQAHALERFAGPLLRRDAGPRTERHAELDVLLGVEAPEQVEGLEEVADVGRAKPVPGALGDPGHRLAGYLDRARIGRQDARDAVEERRLPAAALPAEGEQLAGCDVELGQVPAP